jgi:hypothetical protein
VVFENQTTPGSAEVTLTRQSAGPVNGVPTYPQGLVAADFNGDGRPDILFAEPLNRDVGIFVSAQYRASLSKASATGTIVNEIIFTNGFE